jgi:DNA-binding IclR family transcriptional regulator
MPTKSSNGTQSIERALTLLREISSFGKEGARAAELIQRCQMNYPTAHRILKTLVAENALRKDPGTRRYFLGQLIHELGISAEPPIDLRAQCEPMTTRLAHATGDTVFLYVRSGWDIVCIDRKEGSFPIRAFVFDIGSRRPLGVGAAGIALLLMDPEETAKQIVHANQMRFSRYGQDISADKVLGLVARGRQVGYAAIGDVVFPGVRAVSLPFRPTANGPLLAVSVAAVSSRMPRKRIPQLVALMKKEVANRPKLWGAVTDARDPTHRVPNELRAAAAPWLENEVARSEPTRSWRPMTKPPP